ncbi:adenylate/guanylate cyclase domain-containing protein [Leptospira idonii]|uniref:Adenylate/guanylate cyclase domain-containing protein n=1 Tax=Leptospira idonii TaxID=1193500 RepID=A0A4R9LZT5_9LEPT|nr:7TM diverse intracellular signaling domain-containing protein [Leptospira idonii]TGN18887.1 adenylate/guanylate cyclase domain-containing protein [Leptospira idonii]
MVTLRLGKSPFLFLFLLFFWNCNPSHPELRVKEGKIDLSHFDFSSGQFVTLEGDWEFYPDQFLSPDVPPPSNPYYLTVPKLWNQAPVTSSFRDGQGYGTYRLEIKLPPKEDRYAVYAPEQRTAFRIFMGERSIHSGRVGTSMKSSLPSLQGQNFIHPGKDSVVFLMHVSNFHHKEGGIVSPPLIGNGESVQNYVLAKGTLDLAFTGAIFMFGIYHFILFFYRNKQKEAFFFGLFCLIFSVRILFTGSKTIYAITESIPWDLMMYVDYGTSFLLSAVFLWFIEGLFPRFINTNLIRFYTAVVFFLLVLILILPPIQYTKFETLFQILGLVVFASVLMRLWQMYLRRLPEAGIFLLGSLLLFLGFFADVLTAFKGQGESSLSQVCLFLFFGVQSTIITLRTARTFDKRKQLKDDFETSNDTFIQTNRFYEKFIPREFLHYLEKAGIEDVSLGDSNQREMTVVFADIMEYWDIIYSVPLENRILFTNSYLGRIGPCISKNNGFIDKYIGSAVMALFDGGIQNAIAAATDIQWELEKYNVRRKEYGYIPLHAGVGIHSGDTMLGILGEAERMESTVISDTVNLASRIQGLTKTYSARVLVSLTTLMLHEDLDTIPYRILDFVRVKGKTETVMIAEVLIPGIDEVSDRKIQNKDLFESAIFDYERANFASALEGFHTVYNENPEDKAAEIYIKRSEYFQSAGVGEGWDGVADWEK